MIRQDSANIFFEQATIPANNCSRVFITVSFCRGLVSALGHWLVSNYLKWVLLHKRSVSDMEYDLTVLPIYCLQQLYLSWRCLYVDH